jgi:hypothetical protein
MKVLSLCNSMEIFGRDFAPSEVLVIINETALGYVCYKKGGLRIFRVFRFAPK